MRIRYLAVSSIAILFVLTVFISPLIVFAVGPSVVQVATNDCSACTTVSKAFSSNPISGNILAVFVLCVSGNCGTLNVPTDTIGNTFNLVKTINSGGVEYVNLYLALNKATGADTITETSGMAVSMGIHDYEVTGSNVGFITSTGNNAGTSCGCSVTSYTIPANTITLVGMATNGNPAGVWTFTASMTGVSGANFDIDASQYGTLTGAQTFPTSMNQAINGWAAVAISFNIITPNNQVVNSVGGSAAPNGGPTSATCTFPYVIFGDTLIAVLGSVNSGMTIHTPTDSQLNTYVSQYDSGAGVPELSIWGTTSLTNAFANVITISLTGVGHGAFELACYQVETDSGNFVITNYHGTSSPNCGTTACNVPNGPPAGTLAGTPCSYPLCINEVSYELSGTGTNAPCPTLLTFKNAQTQSGNTAGPVDSNVNVNCLADPGATSNKNIMVDNYGTADGFSTGNPTTYQAISNVTTGGVIGGGGQGDILGVLDSAIVVTTTVTAWNVIDTGTSPNWIIAALSLFFVPAIFWGFIKGSDANPSTTVFLTLVALFLASVLATIGGFEAGANAYFPMGITIFNAGNLIIYTVRSRLRG